jgi:methylglyoxal synthase
MANIEPVIEIQPSHEKLVHTLGKQKNIALIAHDGMKQDMIEWCIWNKKILGQHFLSGTGTTARLISEHTGLPVKIYSSGPLGGDQQIGAKIVEGAIDFIIFFCDPLTSQAHDTDIKALLRISAVYDIPIATNRSSADFMITSTMMNEEYQHKVINYHSVAEKRAYEINVEVPIDDEEDLM